MLDLLAELSGPPGQSPILDAMRLLLEGIRGERSLGRGLRAARQVALKGADSGLAVLFLATWAHASLRQAAATGAEPREAASVLREARALMDAAVSPEVAARVDLVASRLLGVEGNHAARESLLRGSLAGLPQSSPRRPETALELGWVLAEAGCLDNVRAPDDQPAGLLPAADAPAVRFVNCVEAGRIEEAEGLWAELAAASPPGAASQRLRARRQLLDLMRSGSAAGDAAAAPGAERDVPDWMLTLRCLLGGHVHQALRWARLEERTRQATASSRGCLSFNLIRAELAEGNGEAARRLLDIRRARGNTHFLDDFFAARADLLAGRRDSAAARFSQAARSAEAHRAGGRLRFEVLLSPEMPRDALMDLASAAAGSRPAPPAAAAVEPAPAPPAPTSSRDAYGMVGSGDAIRAVRRQVQRFADLAVPVLITGETGTGKELVARALHEASRRRDQPFVAVNCGAISESLLESELFGHAKGAFTGAASARRGLFEETGDGTLLLDEIGEVSPRLQSSLLRVLETGEIRPVGSSRILRAQCRILASTNADLDRLAQESRFRTDLLFRLRRLRIHLPPLRDRPEDIIPLARHFLDLGRPAGTRASIAPDLALALREQPWPGNVRELRNVVERMRLMNSDKLAYELADLEPETRAVPPARSARPAGPSATPIRLRPAHARAAARPLKQGRSGVRRLAILRELFAQHRLMTRSEVAQTLEISPNTATRDLQALAREGLIERVSPSASPRSVYFRLRPGR